MKEYMKSIASFQNYMLHHETANYIRRYCRQLESLGWKRFYFQMKEPLDFITDEKYLFYILKWILKEPFEDLSYEVYLQVVQNPEQISEPLIKDEWWIILNQRCETRWYQMMSELEATSATMNSEIDRSNISDMALNEFIF